MASKSAGVNEGGQDLAGGQDTQKVWLVWIFPEVMCPQTQDTQNIHLECSRG